jgi:hypothetical protein
MIVEADRQMCRLHQVTHGLGEEQRLRRVRIGVPERSVKLRVLVKDHAGSYQLVDCCLTASEPAEEAIAVKVSEIADTVGKVVSVFVNHERVYRAPGGWRPPKELVERPHAAELVIDKDPWGFPTLGVDFRRR